jgi:hypothetical protein
MWTKSARTSPFFRFKKSNSLKFCIISAEVRRKKSMTFSMALMHKISRSIITIGLLISVSLAASAKNSPAFEFNDAVAIGAAYMTHLGMHEVGHQVVAEDVGADTPRMKFFTRTNGKIYPGLSTYKNIPEKSKLPYAVGGERMAGYTFEYALASYHHQPTTYNKALIFFGCADFLLYTLLGNYVHPEDDMYDPNLIRAESGMSKEMLLALVAAKSMLNTYRVFNQDTKVFPVIAVTKEAAGLMLGFRF